MRSIITYSFNFESIDGLAYRENDEILVNKIGERFVMKIFHLHMISLKFRKVRRYITNRLEVFPILATILSTCRVHLYVPCH